MIVSAFNPLYIFVPFIVLQEPGPIIYSLLKCLASSQLITIILSILVAEMSCIIDEHILVLHYFRLIELTTRHRQETEMETERLRTAQLQAERTLEARERAHRQRVKGLEEQVGAVVT